MAQLYLKTKPKNPKPFIGEENGDLIISNIFNYADCKADGTPSSRILITSKCKYCGDEREWNGSAKFRYLKDRKCHCNKDECGLTCGQKQTTDVYYHSYKGDASRRGFEWELTKSEFNKLITSNCYYCGSEPIEKTLKERLQYKRIRARGHIEDYEVNINGVDRKDSSEGYNVFNCVSCCSLCNIMKNVYSIDSFLSHVSKINNYQNSKK